MSIKPDDIDADTLVGMLRKAGRVVERAAKHPDYGSQELWNISASIKREASRILEDEHERGLGCPVCGIISGHVMGCERCPRCHGMQHRTDCSACGMGGYTDDDDYGRSLPTFD